MKIQKLYVCEFCHTQYSDEDRAKKCEGRHKTDLKISAMRFSSLYEFPITIDLVDTAGNVKRYKA